MKKYLLIVAIFFSNSTFSQAVRNICYDSPIPDGWIKTNDMYNPTSCGNPRSISYNVFEIKQINQLPKNSILEVCFDAKLPPGWIINGKKWNPTSCSHPKSFSNNVFTIVKVQ